MGEAKETDPKPNVEIDSYKLDADLADNESQNDETPGTRFAYMYLTKNDSTDNPHMTIFGLEPQDWKHPSIFPVFKDAMKYIINKTQVTVTVKKSADAADEKMDSTDDTATNGDTKPVAEQKYVHEIKLWFEDGVQRAQDIFIKLLKEKFSIRGRPVFIKCQLVISATSMSKQDLDSLLKSYGAKEMQSSYFSRRICFIGIEDKLTEDMVKESIPDLEEIVFCSNPEKKRCCVVALPTPDRAQIVLREKRNTKMFGESKYQYIKYMKSIVDREKLLTEEKLNAFLTIRDNPASTKRAATKSGSRGSTTNSRFNKGKRPGDRFSGRESILTKRANVGAWMSGGGGYPSGGGQMMMGPSYQGAGGYGAPPSGGGGRTSLLMAQSNAGRMGYGMGGMSGQSMGYGGGYQGGYGF